MKSIYLNIKRKINAGLLVKAGGVVLMVAFVLIFTTQSAHAEGNAFEFNLTTLVLDSLANLIYSLQTIASWLIYLAGSLLNFSINLTMHIKEFVSSTDSVYAVWKAIRDISGMFIIFSLLYAAILLIVSYEKPKFDKLLKNIVVAGVLINFSFFLTGLAIDVSNIVSLQLYNAIAPQAKIDGSLNVVGNVASNVWDNMTLKGYMQKSSADGGLSTIFMQALGVTRLYNPDGSISSAGQKTLQAGNSALVSSSMKIILTGVTSIIIMITAALSFFAAALAFMVRFVILIFLLAFSPILFASYVVPEIDEYVGKWRKYLKSQLIFMPVYLLLMYVALSVVTSSSIFKEGYAGSLSGNGGFLADLMILAVNAVLIILMLNFPLLGAISMGAMMPEWAKKMGAEDIWKKVGGWTLSGARRGGASAYQNTVSRGASAIARSDTLKNFASRSWIGEKALKGVRNTAKGYDEKLATQVKERTSFAESLGEDKAAINALNQQRRQLQQQQAALNAAGNTAAANALNGQITAIGNQITREESRRQQDYATRTNTRQIDTLWTKVARKDRVAANKLQIGAVKKQLANRQQALQRVQEGITNRQNTINNLQTQISSGQSRNVPQAQATIANLQAQNAAAHAQVATLLTNPGGTGVHDLEAIIEQMETIS